MSIEAENSVVLVPLVHADNEASFAQAFCHLGLGQQITLTLEDHSLLVVTRSTKDNGPRFQVEKVTISPSSYQEATDEVKEWRLDAPDGRPVLQPDSGVNCIFLGPSIINHSLYGGTLPPGKTFAQRFGIIKPEQDPDDGQWKINITMPAHPYRALSKLSITQTL